MGFIIYPLNLNIIHFILFNKLDINILLKVIIFIIYNKNESANSKIININFKSNYEKLLLNLSEKDINLEDSIYLELITKIKELENKIKNNNNS